MLTETGESTRRGITALNDLDRAMRRGPPRSMMWRSLLTGPLLLSLAACGSKPAPEVEPAVCEEPTEAKVSGFTQCGPTSDLTPINSYRGEFSDLPGTEDAVVLLDGRCTGTLIAASAGPVVLTAGHCVGLGDRSLAVFNYEDQPDGEEFIVEGTVIEQSMEPDYALIRLDVLPAAIPPLLLTTRSSERLAIIQHPRGRPKAIAEGSYLDSCNRLVYYKDLDTLVGTSGAGILTRQGHVLGVHTDGDCDTSGKGANRGWTAEAIVEVSEYLQGTDIADR
ncbi:trypsin-like serine peptidase [Corallococcus terminator]